KTYRIDTIDNYFSNPFLDVGYDGISPEIGFINNILNKYFHEYFPRAANLSQQLREGGYVENFIYTTHPWLVDMFLNCQPLTLAGVKLICPNKTEIDQFVTAVIKGDITWHAGPMNMQPENMNRLLFDLSLNISSDLDKTFNVSRMSMATLSQRDVPGMTQAVIPSLINRGIGAVSVGVNPSTSPPAVPNLFRWGYKDQEVLATWHPGGYPLDPGPNPAHPGGLSKKDCVVVEGFDQALCFAFITDNRGPPKDIEEILGYYEILRAEFPGADIQASQFEWYFSKVQSIRSMLPLIRQEIGDTWIQGIASDPMKMAYYRALSDSLTSCVEKGACNLHDHGQSGIIANIVRYLIKPPEHTWGLPSVGDTLNWTNSAFNKAKNDPNYVNCTMAWDEQRAFLNLAIYESSVIKFLNDCMMESLLELEPKLPDLTGYEEVPKEQWYQKYTCEDLIQISFNPDGSLQKLYDPYNKVDWSAGTSFGQVIYYTYNETDFQFMSDHYGYYGNAGFDKHNSTENAHPESSFWLNKIEKMYKLKTMGRTGSCDIIVQLTMIEPRSYTYYGAPRAVYINYKSRGMKENIPGGFDVSFMFVNKTATRLPESLMYLFNPRVPSGDFRWWLSKLGHLIDPSNVILNGSQYVHAVDSQGVFYIQDNGHGLQLGSQHVPLVAMTTQTRVPAPFPVPLKPISMSEITGMAFNLYNNIWDTNYILWYPYHQEDNSFKAKFYINFPGNF
ncbi:hypothetical protein FSP39_006109, partial [Pinctada imbricata]